MMINTAIISRTSVATMTAPWTRSDQITPRIPAMWMYTAMKTAMATAPHSKGTSRSTSSAMAPPVIWAVTNPSSATKEIAR
jgi:hypothetical protein